MENLLLWIMGVLFTILITIVGFFVKQLYVRLDKVEKEMSEMRINYVDRFEKAKDDRNEIKLSILKSISDIKLQNEISHNAILEVIREKSK